MHRRRRQAESICRAVRRAASAAASGGASSNPVDAAVNRVAAVLDKGINRRDRSAVSAAAVVSALQEPEFRLVLAESFSLVPAAAEGADRSGASGPPPWSDRRSA